MDETAKTTRRGVLGAGAGIGAAAMAAVTMGLPLPVLAADGKWGPARKLVWVPQALGDWDTAMQVGFRDFCEMVGWSYQRIGNPNYSVENHVEQVNNAIASGADVIVTELESEGLVGSFQSGLDAGIAMIINDQGIEAEAKALGLGIINQDEFNAGIINGTAAARFAQKLTGKKGGVIVLGNGNPGSTSIDKRQNGSKQGIEAYNKENGTSFTFEAFPDNSFGEMTQSVQKWTAKIDEKGSSLVGAIGTGNPLPIVQAMKERKFKPGQIACGSTDIPPAHQQAIADGWVQWGIDQQFYLMGFLSAATAWVQLERKYPYPSIRTGGELVTADNLKMIGQRTDIWVAQAKAYGIM